MYMIKLLGVCVYFVILLSFHPGYYLLVSFTVFTSLAGLGYMHRRTNILAKVIPTARSRHGSGPLPGHDGSQWQPVHDFQLL